MRANAITQKRAFKQGWKCHLCGFEMARDAKHGVEILRAETLVITVPRVTGARIIATFDHVIPQSAGGTRHNGKIACAWCNSFRGHLTIDDAHARFDAMLAAGLHPRQILRETGLWPRRAGGAAIRKLNRQESINGTV